MMKEGSLNLHARGSRLLWRLQIWRCEMPADGDSSRRFLSVRSVRGSTSTIDFTR